MTKIREDFEAWARTGDDPLVGEDFKFLDLEGRYYWKTTQVMWEAWQASRANLVIDLWDIHKASAFQDNAQVISLTSATLILESEGVAVK